MTTPSNRGKRTDSSAYIFSVLGLATLALGLTQFHHPNDIGLFLLLLFLVLFSDATSVVVEGGNLTNSFLWFFAAVCSGLGAGVYLLVLISAILRLLIWDRGCDWASRLASVSGETMACSISLLVFQIVEASDFTYDHIVAAVGCVLAHYSLSLVSLKFESTQSEVVQTLKRQNRIGLYLFCPLLLILSRQNPYSTLFIVPVLLGVSRFSKSDFREFRRAEVQARHTETALQQTHLQLEKQEKALQVTEVESSFHQDCLIAFQGKSSASEIGDVLVDLSSRYLEFELFAIFRSDDLKGVEPLGFWQYGGARTKLTSESFQGGKLLKQVRNKEKALFSPPLQAFAAPIRDFGYLYLSGLSNDEIKIRKMVLNIATNAAFGFRSASLFRQVTDSLNTEKATKEKLQESLRLLEESQQQLLQASKMSAVGNLAAGIAHEVNTPLASILITVESLIRSIKRNKFEKLLPRLETCRDATEQARRVVDEFLSFARNDQVAQSICNLKSLCREALAFAEEILRKYKVAVELDVGEEIEVVGSRTQLQQVLGNLISNASRSFEGAVKAGVEPKIQIKARADSEIRLSVRDNGTGIDEEIQNRIFEPFFTTREVGKGTGLGLYISREIANRHGGELKLLDSNPSGTTFELTMPVPERQ